MKKHILIVDDDNDILELLEYNLSNAGYEVFGFLNTKHVRKVLSEEDIDLIIMDRNLPDIEGSQYVEMLRSKNINTPVIFLSAKDTLDDRKEGFLRGADDYMTKPFDIGELLLRINAVLKRYNQEQKELMQSIEYKDITLDMVKKTAYINDDPVSLTILEFNLLSTFVKNVNKPLTRDFLREEAWGSEKDEVNDKTVNVAIKRLKEKIDPTKEKNYIQTIRGVGYILP